MVKNNNYYKISIFIIFKINAAVYWQSPNFTF